MTTVETCTITGPYSGIVYTICWHQNQSQPEQSCWTYQWTASDGYRVGADLSSERQHHATPEAAGLCCLDEDLIQAARHEYTPLSRNEYETRAAELGVESYPDTDIAARCVGRFQMPPEHPVATCAARYLAERRLMAIKADRHADRPAAPRQLDVVAAVFPAALKLAKRGPGGLYKPDARHTNQPCARCGAPAMWIAGAGEALCVDHQDDY